MKTRTKCSEFLRNPNPTLPTEAERLSKSKELLISLQIELDEEQAAINALVEESEQSLKKQKDDGDEAQKKANEITNQTNQKIDESMQWKNEIQQAEEVSFIFIRPIDFYCFCDYSTYSTSF